MRFEAVLAVLALATTAYADDPLEPQRMKFVENGEYLTVTTLPNGGIGSLFDTKTYEALKSGITSTVVIRIQITPEGSDIPVAEQLIRRQVVYDVWDENFSVQLEEPGGTKKFKVTPHAEALKWLTRIDDLVVARLSVLPYEKVFVLKMVAELNPVSKETLAEVRRWLSQGTGGGLDRGGAFFGSFVSVFYNPKIAEADRIVRLQSKPFYRPPRDA